MGELSGEFENVYNALDRAVELARRYGGTVEMPS